MAEFGLNIDDCGDTDDFEPVSDIEDFEPTEGLDDIDSTEIEKDFEPVSDIKEALEPMDDTQSDVSFDEIGNIGLNDVQENTDIVDDIDDTELDVGVSRADQIDALYDIRADLERLRDEGSDDQAPDVKTLSLHM